MRGAIRHSGNLSSGATMRKLMTVIILISAFFLWILDVGASPIGDRLRIWPDFQYKDDVTYSQYSGALDEATDENSDMDLLFGDADLGRKKASAFKLLPEADRTKIPVTAFIFSYGAHLHEWEVPRLEVPISTPFFQERPFDYKGPPPDPKPLPVIQPEEGDRYRYPEELMPPVHMPPTGLTDTFELEYAMQLEEDAARFRYPFAPKDLPEPEKRLYIYGEVSPGTGAGDVGYGPAQQQYGYQYPAGRGYGPGIDAAGELEKRPKKGKRGESDFNPKGSSSAGKDRPYAMILLGAGLAAVAALFRMFRLSLLVMVGWAVFFWKDLWLIISELQ